MMDTGQLSISLKDSLVIKIGEDAEEASIEEFTSQTPWLEKAKSGIKVSVLKDHIKPKRLSELKTSSLQPSKSVIMRDYAGED